MVVVGVVVSGFVGVGVGAGGVVVVMWVVAGVGCLMLLVGLRYLWFGVL